VWLALYRYHKLKLHIQLFIKDLCTKFFFKSDEQLNWRLLKGHHLCISVEVMELWERLNMLFKLVTITHSIKSIINTFFNCLSIHYASVLNENLCEWVCKLQKRHLANVCSSHWIISLHLCSQWIPHCLHITPCHILYFWNFAL
jgi:hypothetical protein